MVSKAWKPNKPTVELQPAPKPSRIRREPVPVSESSEKKLSWRTSEQEIWIALIGVVAFALAIDIIVVAISTYWN